MTWPGPGVDLYGGFCYNTFTFAPAGGKAGYGLISVILPVYNCEAYLAVCIESVLNQRYSDLELLLIDDGSSDRSGQICDTYAQKDGRVRVFHTKNYGASHARNVGLEQAQGEWIGFVDSDDAADSFLLERLYNGAVQADADSALCGYTVCGPDLKPLSSGAHIEQKQQILTGAQALAGVFSDPYYRTRQGYLWNRLFKAAVIQEHQIRFDTDVVFSEDKLFICRCLLHCQRIFYTTAPLYRYRTNPVSLTKAGGYLRGARDELRVFQLLQDEICADEQVKAALYGWHIHNCIARLYTMLRERSDDQELHDLLFAQLRQAGRLTSYKEVLGVRQRWFGRIYRRIPRLIRRLCGMPF